MPQQNQHNEWVHIDLFGPLISDRGYRYIMVMTEAFSKFVKLQPLPDKTADSVADAFFATWICEFGVTECIVIDGGREFCNKVLQGICEKLSIDHRITTRHHPQTNAQAETFNKTMAKYRRSFADQVHPTWVDLLPPLDFTHNTSHHLVIGTTPHALVMTFKPRYP